MKVLFVIHEEPANIDGGLGAFSRAGDCVVAKE